MGLTVAGECLYAGVKGAQLDHLIPIQFVAGDAAEISQRYAAFAQEQFGRARVFEFDVTLDQIEKLLQLPRPCRIGTEAGRLLRQQSRIEIR